MGGGDISSITGAGKTGKLHVKKNDLYHHTQKISSKFIKDRNVRFNTVKLLEENIGRTL